MVTLFLATTALIWCTMIATSILWYDGRPGEITKTLAATTAASLGLTAYIWAITWAATTLTG